MGQFWTKKKEDYDKDDTMQADDFLLRVTESNTKKKTVYQPKIENTK